MKRTAMAALVFAVSLAWGTAMGAVPAEKTGKALAGAAAVTAEKAGNSQTAPKAAKAAAYGTSDKDGKVDKKADKTDKDGKDIKPAEYLDGFLIALCQIFQTTLTVIVPAKNGG